MSLKKLPLGIQTFGRIREENYLYIDKTKEAYNLINSGNIFYFLSRPRRFGKSLFIDTLQDIFEARKELFKDLYIYDKWDWKEKYPVIKFDLKSITNTQELLKDLKVLLKENQAHLDIFCEETDDYANCFRELIQKTAKKYNTQVVVLVDEYDKPILDTIDKLEVSKANREILKRFYNELKSNEQYIKFCFLTGVSKFSKASIFSGLNMLTDISLNPKYGNICGYTQEDIETSFKDYLVDVDLEKFKNYYNGYNFLKDPVYNPFDTLQFIINDFKYSNYWFSSGTPTFLIKLIEKNNYFLPTLSNLTIGEELLDSFNIENIDLEVILYQSGYLTIDSVKEKRRGGIEYKLKLPNIEVKNSFNDILIDYLTNQKTEKLKLQDDLYDAIVDEKLEDFKSSFETIFASIPYNNYTNNSIQNYEGYYASIVYVYLQSLGLEIIGEDVTSKGRIDLTIKINNIIYIIEFKIGSNDALIQIKEKDYAQKYQREKKTIYLVGINFDKEERNISRFEWERL